MKQIFRYLIIIMLFFTLAIIILILDNYLNINTSFAILFFIFGFNHKKIYNFIFNYMKQLTLKQILPYLVMALLIILASVYLQNCRGGEPKLTLIDNKDSLYTLIAEKEQINEFILENNKELRLQLDSVTHLKPRVIMRYKTVYDSLLITDTACVNSLTTLNNECAKKDSVNEYIISNQSSQICNLITVTNNLNDIIDIQRYRMSTDSINEVTLKQTIQNEIKNGKRKYRKGLLQGVVVGLGVGVVGTLLSIK